MISSNGLPWKAPAKIAYTPLSPPWLRSARNDATNERCQISGTVTMKRPNDEDERAHSFSATAFDRVQ